MAGQGPAVLLTHGFASSSHVFDATARALASEHTVITWDLRGHAASDHADDPAAYSVPLAVGDMVALLDTTGADQAVAVGHSLGGYLSLELRLSHPERVAGLALVDTGPGYRRDESRAEWNRLAGQYAADLIDRGLDGLPDSDDRRVDVHGSAVGLAHAAMGMLPQQDARVLESLSSIDVPTLVVVGADDTPFLSGSRYMASKIPGAQLVVVEGAAHTPPVSHPNAFVAALREFLATPRGV